MAKMTMNTRVMTTKQPNPITRRGLLFTGAALGVGAAAGLGADVAVRNAETEAIRDTLSKEVRANGPRLVPFYGEHQAGIEILPQSHQTLVALSLKNGVDADAIRRMMRILSDDAARLTQGRPALADSEPEMAELPARLTVTFGFGPELVKRVRPSFLPTWLRPLEHFSIDRLEERWNGGDLMIQVASDDQLSIAHTLRMLLKDSRSFATVKWVQAGFRNGHGSLPPNHTQRNLFGQLDGTVNALPGSKVFAEQVWQGSADNPSWLSGGTGFVVRRIAMNLDKWDELDRPGREESIGRTLDTGAPLTGRREHDEPDFTATNAVGFPVIADFAHIRRARSENPNEAFYRRVYNYELPPEQPNAISSSGLIFTGYQHNVDTQFTPIQRRLAELDLLNEWTTPIGSAVFAIPPGCAPGGFIGETLF